MNKATPRQQAFLAARGIKPPATNKMCSRYIGFIKHNNGAGPASESERIALLKSIQEKWQGKRAVSKITREEVTVLQVFPKFEGEVLIDRRDNKMIYDTSATGAFMISYTSEKEGKKKGRNTHLSGFQLLE